VCGQIPKQLAVVGKRYGPRADCQSRKQELQRPQRTSAPPAAEKRLSSAVRRTAGNEHLRIGPPEQPDGDFLKFFHGTHLDLN